MSNHSYCHKCDTRYYDDSPYGCPKCDKPEIVAEENEKLRARVEWLEETISSALNITQDPKLKNFLQEGLDGDATANK